MRTDFNTMKKIVEIFTDGACRGNPGPGGWGVLLRYGSHEKMLSGAEPHTTNNRMEIIAAIKALADLKYGCEVNLYTDSKYVKDGITLWIHGWKKKNWFKTKTEPVKNADLWKELDLQTQRHTIHWHWVKGHSGHIENDRVDALAVQAIDIWLKNNTTTPL